MNLIIVCGSARNSEVGKRGYIGGRELNER